MCDRCEAQGGEFVSVIDAIQGEGFNVARSSCRLQPRVYPSSIAARHRLQVVGATINLHGLRDGQLLASDPRRGRLARGLPRALVTQGESVHARVASRVEARALEPLRLKGKTEPERAYELR